MKIQSLIYQIALLNAVGYLNYHIGTANNTQKYNKFIQALFMHRILIWTHGHAVHAVLNCRKRGEAGI